MTRPAALVLSPHLDDAAFSCGGTLARLAAEGWRVIIATFFTASVPNPTGFALACQLDKGLGPEVDYMALRRAEDARACKALGAEPVWLPFREAPHRGYGSAPELFGPVHAEDDATRLGLMEAIRDLLGHYEPDLILAPQAIGGHVDHVQLVRAVKDVDLPIPISWWRDYPYTVRKEQRAELFEPIFRAMPEQVVELGERHGQAKRLACLAYGSQLGFQFGGPAALEARLIEAGSSERFRSAEIVVAEPTGG